MSIRDKVGRLFKPGDGLRQQVARGGVWVFINQGTREGLRFARYTVLARLLGPSDMGLMTIALLAMAALERFTQSGVNRALVQKKDNTEKYLNTAWTINLLRGFVLGGVLFGAAPLVAAFFGEPAAEDIVRAVALAVFVRGLHNIGIIYFDKELAFRKRFVFEASGALADLVVAVSAVLITRSVWAMVYGLLAGEFTRLILSYVLHPYRPRPRLNLDEARELFGFGKWVLASTVILYMLNQGDDVVVGKLLGVAALGLYRTAYRYSNLPATQITHVISRVSFPAYAKLQDNLPGLREAYLKTLRLTAVIGIPMAGGIFVLAPDITRVILGEQWMAMVPALRVLALYGAIRSVGSTGNPLFLGTGNPRTVTKLTIIQLVILSAIIYPLTTTWGIMGTAAAVLAASGAARMLTAYEVTKLIEIKPTDIIRLLFFPAFGTAAFIAGLWFLRPLLDSVGGFVAMVAIGVAIYLAVMYLADVRFGLRYRAMLRELWANV